MGILQQVFFKDRHVKKERTQCSIETHNCHLLDRNNGKLFYNNNIDNIVTSPQWKKKQFFHVSLNPTCPRYIFAYSTWPFFKGTFFDIELENIERFRFRHRTLIQCHARKNLLSFSGTYCYDEGHTFSIFTCKNLFHNFQ